MSKSKPDYSRERKFFDGDRHPHSDDLRNHRREKHLKTALKTKNIDELIHIDDDFDEDEELVYDADL